MLVSALQEAVFDGKTAPCHHRRPLLGKIFPDDSDCLRPKDVRWKGVAKSIWQGRIGITNDQDNIINGYRDGVF